MNLLQMLGLGRLFKSKLQRRLAALTHAAQEVNMISVAAMRAEWLRRTAEASRQQTVDSRLGAAR